jgi:hypothetical protein
MSKSQAKPAAVGFLSIVEHESLGVSGGYLVLNLAARPLEFHFTAPLKPNRAQEILYGPTLEPYLCGEQIGQALVNKCGLELLGIFVDRMGALAVRPYVDTPVAMVENATRDTGCDSITSMIRFEFGNHTFVVPAAQVDDGQRLLSRTRELGESFDLAEPFERIQAAIEEAQRSSRKAA